VKIATCHEEDIAHIVASWTGVPVNKLTESESEKLHMEDTHQRPIGQEEAVGFQSNSPREGRFEELNRPIASLCSLDQQV